MGLHGHTVIELTDVETGEKEIHEDDNLVTNALQLLLGNYGVFGNNPLLSLLSNATKESVMSRLTGGIMLFDGKIDEDVNIIKPPAGVSVVACGAGEAYTGNNVMAGSYNKNESGEIESGWKHVWDFSTNQGNGSISCACLTTRAGGKITEGTFPFSSDYLLGNGDGSRYDYNFIYSSNALNLKAYRDDSGAYMHQGILHVDGKRNRYLRPSTYAETSRYVTNFGNFEKSMIYKKSLDIDIFRVPINNFSIFDFNSSDYTNPDDMLLETVTVDMPQELKDLLPEEKMDSAKNYYWSTSRSCDEKYVYITIKVPNTTGNYSFCDAGDDLYVWKISVNDFSSTFYKVTNTTGEKIRCYCGYFNDGVNFLYTVEQYTFVIGESNKMYVINNKNNADVTEIKYPDGSSFINSGSIYDCIYDNDKLLFRPGQSDIEDKMLIYDTKSKEVRFKNATYDKIGASSSSKPNTVYKVYGTHYMVASYSNFYRYLGLLNDPELLVTINNLSSPVLKTASQTMKITYTLTES